MKLPKSIQDVVDGFESLPGIGPKTAQRLAFYLLRMPKDDVEHFGHAVNEIKSKTQICEKCFNVSEEKTCDVCGDDLRDRSVLCVVESPLDVLAMEKSGYKGLYHVLHGVLNPIAGIGPDEIFLDQLFTRLGSSDSIKIKEIILATNTSLEGESTAMYIAKGLKERFDGKIKVSRIGKGLPIGADIEYADEQTLNDALSGRIQYNP
ncbi:recombination protein RecR [candidate division WWE3 bacterium RIFCSPLOWO2_01_FULL_39_13]|uniref:Recombination protein RecR n=1 Tax=candidate division WWE3 bacterium RIFCSPLOWO2_01_FULL_39_13 TaxID=1802624 RepID=A0A1F4V4R0_UNCKA|nr:MAG: recombination protein RecR [candidate division WWE3 bacterium RIFCSPLOWO2_01_FULL_39_13]